MRLGTEFGSYLNRWVVKIEGSRVLRKEVGADQVLHDHCVDPRRSDLSHHPLQRLELCIEDKDVQHGIAEDPVSVKVSHDFGKLRVGVEVGRSSPRVELGEAEVYGIGTVLDCRTKLRPSACRGEDFRLATNCGVLVQNRVDIADHLLVQAGIFPPVSGI